MSARPRTDVSRTIPVLRNRWILFAGPTKPPRLDVDVLARLDEQWRSIGMTGAALLHPVTGDLTQHVVPAACRDRRLTLNVLLRARGSLLLAAMPLLDDPDAVVGVRMATDDPRLVAHGLERSGR
jgi:hypothetical protein